MIAVAIEEVDRWDSEILEEGVDLFGVRLRIHYGKDFVKELAAPWMIP